MTANELLFALLRFEIANEPLSNEIKENMDIELLSKVIKIAENHSLAHLIADAIQKNAISVPDKMAEYLKKQKNLALMRYVQMNEVLKRIKAVLDKEQIPYLPLKGAVLQQYYPEAWMRNSCDMDILVHKEDLEKAIAVLCDTMHFKAEAPGSHDVSLLLGTVHIELHFDLVEDGRANEAKKILNRVWAQSRQLENSYEYIMPDEMFYFYHVAHMVKHFEVCGIGIRHFLDLWILNHKVTFDAEKRNALLQEGNLVDFANAAELLTETWLSKKNGTELTNRLEEFVLQGATYGSSGQRASVSMKQKESTAKYIWKRLFLPYSKMKKLYPKLEGKKWLLPFYWVLRLFTALFNPSMRKIGLTEIDCVNSMAEEEIGKISSLMQDLKL